MTYSANRNLDKLWRVVPTVSQVLVNHRFPFLSFGDLRTKPSFATLGKGVHYLRKNYRKFPIWRNLSVKQEEVGTYLVVETEVETSTQVENACQTGIIFPKSFRFKKPKNLWKMWLWVTCTQYTQKISCWKPIPTKFPWNGKCLYSISRKQLTKVQLNMGA